MWDFVIIGAGTAGIPAAVFAAQRGGRVLLLDAADVIGGTMHLANGQVSAAGTRTQIAKGIVDTPDRHYAEAMQVCRGLADPGLVRRTVDEAPATVNWLLDNGLTPLPDLPATGESPGRPAYTTPRYIWGAGRGKDLLAAAMKSLQPEIERGRVQTVVKARATEFLCDGDGAVTGVRANVDGKAVDYSGRHVLLATGGYAMNPTLFESLIGSPAYAAGSYPTCQGDGLKMVTDIGGSLRGHGLHRAGSGSILTADKFPAKVYARFSTTPQTRQPWEIWVDVHGRRFIREDEPATYTRDRAVAALPKLKYVIVFDQTIFAAAPPGIEGWPREKIAQHFGTHPMFHQADTLDGLAEKVGVAGDGLRATVAEYNASVAGGTDGLGRRHMPLPIAKPPFYGIIHLGHSATSSIGVNVDTALRVLRQDGSAIPNLYAVGEVMGSGATLGNAFVPGMMLTPALALGRWLGMTLLVAGPR